MGSGGSPFAFGGAVVGGAIGSVVPGAGTAVGAQWGATIGTVAEALFSKPKDSARSADTRWGGSTYGTSISRGWGTHRTDAPIFWGVRNKKDGSYLFKHNAKKRKKSGSQNVAHYRATFAFLILETGLTYADEAQTQVERRIVVDRVWMADKIVWVNKDAAPIPAWSSAKTYYYGDHVSRSGNTYNCVSDGNLNHPPPSGSNEWWQKVSTGKNMNIRFHPGEGESTFTQAVDSIMASHDGIANTSAMRGSTYGVADDVDLFDVGNTVPQNVSVEWHWADECYLRDLLSDACGLSGMPLGSYDFSDLAEKLMGYRQTARQSGVDLLGSPLSIKGYDLVSIDGVARAVKRGGGISHAIGAGELGGTLDGTPVDRLDEQILADASDLHSSLKLGYFDAAAGFRQAYQIAARNDHGVANPTDLASDLVMTPVEAAQAAGRLLDTEWLEAGATFGISLLGDHSGMVGTDAITIPYRGRSTRFRVMGTEFVQNLVKLKLARDEPEVLVRYESAVTPIAAAADDGTIVPTAFVVLSPQADLSTEMATYPGFYVFANGPAGWLGGQVVYSFDPPGTENREWVDGPFVADASTFGVLTGALDGSGTTTPPPTPPAAPTGLAATAGNAQVALAWNAVGDATSYGVKRSMTAGGPYSVVQSGLSTTAFTDAGLANGTIYWYVVSATNAEGESPNSAQASATPAAPTTPPAAPTGLTATGGTSKVALAWNASAGATSYTLRRGTSSGTYPDTVATGLTSLSYVDAGRTNGQAYYYSVVAVNAAGTGPSSSVASATPIAVPSGLAATPGNGSVSLTWSAAAGATGYRVRYGTAAGGPYGTTLTVSGTSATVSGLTNGTTYRFVVTGTNTVGESDPSAEASATPTPATGVPGGGTGDPTGDPTDPESSQP